MKHSHHQSSSVAPFLGLLVIGGLMGLLVYMMKGDVTDGVDSRFHGNDKQENATSTPTVLRVYTRDQRKPYRFDSLFVVDVTHGSSTEESYDGARAFDEEQLNNFSIEQPSASSSASLVVGNGWRVALRTREGVVLQDPQIIGTRSDKELYVSAHTLVPSVYLVKREGDIRELAQLSETQRILWTDVDGVWIVDQAPSDGIERAPTGPSSLWFASISDAPRPLATSSKEITHVIGNASRFVWTSSELIPAGKTENEGWFSEVTMHIQTPSTSTQRVVIGIPMAWIHNTLVYWMRSDDSASVDLVSWNEASGTRVLWTTDVGIPVSIELLSGSDL